jgi:ubiquinone/menaquinone biosynthesis C-methylase UbiE
MKLVRNLSSKCAAALEDPWEAAYARFETPEEEIEKFAKRLRKFGAARWPRDARIVELFCGRGNGLRALERFGFTQLEGADLSPTLLAQYRGTAKCHVCDCRRLPFENQSKDLLIVQGGLHHLSVLPDDLAQTFAEMRRVLTKDGRLVLVEPWLTPFLRFVHKVCEIRLARRISDKVDALATMIEHEKRTYDQWLGNQKLVLATCYAHFRPVQERFAWGKWSFIGMAV